MDATICSATMDALMAKFDDLDRKGPLTEAPNAGPASTAAKPTTGTAVSADAPLGDLSAFKRIVADTQALVNKGDLDAAKSRITDLESAWDTAEETLRATNPAKWELVDESIDKALAQLRSDTPEAAACSAALETLMAKLMALDKRP